MDSSLVRKIEKAKDYSVQPGRVTLKQFTASFQGDNDSHEISYDGGEAKCSCHYFSGHNTCSHVMAIEMMLKEMVSAQPVTSK